MEISNLKTQRINQNDYHKNIFTRNKIGALYTFPKRFTPEDCLSCDGYVLKIIDFSELYEIIGTTFNSGTEADDEFRIPDYNLTGRFLQPGNKNLGTTKNAGIPSIRDYCTCVRIVKNLLPLQFESDLQWRLYCHQKKKSLLHKNDGEFYEVF